MKISLILHNIRSLHNVGSMFRTADAVGVKKIYLTGYTPSPYDFFGKLRKEFAKTALGAEKSVAWERKNRTNFLRSLKVGTFVVAVEQSNKSVSLTQFSKLYQKKLKKYSAIALVFGNEVTGLSQTVMKKADAIVEIPMRGKKESLNVSVAAGIALFSLCEQLGGFTSK